MRWLVYSVMRDLYPKSAAFPGIADCDLPTFWRNFRREAPWSMQFGVKAAVWVFALSPLFTLGVPLPSFLLPATLRDLHAQRITTTSFYYVRQLMTLLKMIASFCWGQDAKVRACVNLPAYPEDPGTWRKS